ncbi:unnamed protein product, partial [Effrenium voratum]
VQQRRAELAAALAPCTVCTLIFDEEACRCRNLTELVRLYTRRVNAHRMMFKDTVDGEPLALAAWSFGRVIASALAVSLESSGVQDVRLVLFDDTLLMPEPIPKAEDRWLGGGAEAVLLAARGCAPEWAASQRQRLRGSTWLSEDDVEDLQMRLFWEEGAKPGHLQRMGPRRFAELANTTGRKVDHLRSLTRTPASLASFEGRASLVELTDSRPKVAKRYQHLIA